MSGTSSKLISMNIPDVPMALRPHARVQVIYPDVINQHLHGVNIFP